jgi:isocitrate/isopropylmalate dehydrogenase
LLFSLRDDSRPRSRRQENSRAISSHLCSRKVDIVSDLCAGLVGGLGFAPSANLGDKYAVFEPTHGSAPKYAGQYKVNPIAMLLTVKLMFDWLKETEMATRLESAIARVIAEGRCAPTIWAEKLLPST